MRKTHTVLISCPLSSHLLLSPCDFPSIATAQRECFTLKIGKGGNGENTHDAGWRRVSNQIEDIIVFPLKFGEYAETHRRY